MNINIKYFSIGIVLALLVLAIRTININLLNQTGKILDATASAVFEPKPTPAPYDFEQDFRYACMAHSEGNKAYCDCSVDLVKGDPVWDDGSGEALYLELKYQLAEICMISS